MIYGSTTTDGAKRPLLPAALAPIGAVRSARQPDGSTVDFVNALVVLVYGEDPLTGRPMDEREGVYHSTRRTWMTRAWMGSAVDEQAVARRAEDLQAGLADYWLDPRVARAVQADPSSVVSTVEMMRALRASRSASARGAAPAQDVAS